MQPAHTEPADRHLGKRKALHPAAGGSGEVQTRSPGSAERSKSFMLEPAEAVNAANGSIAEALPSSCALDSMQLSASQLPAAPPAVLPPRRASRPIPCQYRHYPCSCVLRHRQHCRQLG